MMLSFMKHVTLRRLCRRAYSKAYRMIFSLPGREMSLMQDVTSGVIWYSMPAYRSSSFSRTITTSMLGCLVSMNGWYETHGRTLAYCPSVFLVVTLRLLKPPPCGVGIGAFRKTLVRSSDSQELGSMPAVLPRR